MNVPVCVCEMVGVRVRVRVGRGVCVAVPVGVDVAVAVNVPNSMVHCTCAYGLSDGVTKLLGVCVWLPVCEAVWERVPVRLGVTVRAGVKDCVAV